MLNVDQYSSVSIFFWGGGEGDFLKSRLSVSSTMLPFSPVLLLLYPAALFVAAQGVGDLHGFAFPGGSAAFDPTGAV